MYDFRGWRSLGIEPGSVRILARPLGSLELGLGLGLELGSGSAGLELAIGI